MIHNDPIFENWLRANWQEMTQFPSAIIHLVRCFGDPPQRYLVEFHCTGLVKRNGEVQKADLFRVGIHFHPDYLRYVDALRLVCWQYPTDVFHPNIAAPFVCLGTVQPGLSLKLLCHRLYDLIRYANYAPHDGLNPEACQWARNHTSWFPLDRRALKGGTA